ncbi:MAG: guanylate kinase [Firmicutes bacterium]|nr:guanylate kinase [Bacillota bacterium]
MSNLPASGKGLLFVMSGPSGTGKGTICGELIKSGNIFLSVSSTTREKRKGEIDGVTYNYTTVDEFEKMIAGGEMLEYAKYGDNYYGTPKKTVTEMLAAGKNVLLEIEPQGAALVKSKMPEAVLLFILPPSARELKKRLCERGRESDEEIAKRLQAAGWELSQAPLYNKMFVNDDLGECVERVGEYISEKTRERAFLDNLIEELQDI